MTLRSRVNCTSLGVVFNRGKKKLVCDVTIVIVIFILFLYVAVLFIYLCISCFIKNKTNLTNAKKSIIVII